MQPVMQIGKEDHGVSSLGEKMNSDEPLGNPPSEVDRWRTVDTSGRGYRPVKNEGDVQEGAGADVIFAEGGGGHHPSRTMDIAPRGKMNQNNLLDPVRRRASATNVQMGVGLERAIEDTWIVGSSQALPGGVETSSPFLSNLRKPDGESIQPLQRTLSSLSARARAKALAAVGGSNRRNSEQVLGSDRWDTRSEAGPGPTRSGSGPGQDVQRHTAMRSLDEKDGHETQHGHEFKRSPSSASRQSRKMSQHSMGGISRTVSAVSNGPLLPSASVMGHDMYAVSNDSSDFAVEVSSGERFRNIVNSRCSTIFSLLFSSWMLVGRDMYLLLSESTEYDTAAFTISTVCMVVLLLEIVVWTKAFPETYAFGVQSILDFVAAMSLLPDLISLTLPANFDDVHFLSPLVIARVSFAAMYGGQLVKALRMAYSMMYSESQKGSEKRKEGGKGGVDGNSNADEMSSKKKMSSFEKSNRIEEGGSIDDLQDKDKISYRESEVGSKLNRGMAHIQIGVVAAILVVAHILQLWSKSNALDVTFYAMANQAHFLVPDLSSDLAGRTLDIMSKGSVEAGLPMRFVEVDGRPVWGALGDLTHRRRSPSEVMTVSVPIGDGKKASFWFDARLQACDHYLSSIVTVLCVIVILGGSTVVMSFMVHKDVAVPMQRMVQLVTSFAEDPLRPLPPAEDSNLHPLKETVILQNALVKLGSLLQLGFGEAGAAMLSKTINNTRRTPMDGQTVEETSEEAVGRILTVGRVVQAFFGFCDIRSFTDLTEILQADVVRVANSVARHVHQSVRDNFGAPNKNLGDTFLLVWMTRYGSSVRKIADAALRSFIRAVLEVSRNKGIAKICNRPDVQHRMPNFELKLGFGLHYGWAIECAIGSPLKIDASYLSPHVNLASRLQSATKKYGVSILISGATYALFSPYIQSKCRLVDRVTLKGSAHPMELYTYDVPPASVNGVSVVDDEIISSTSTPDQVFFSSLQPSTSERFRNQFSLGMDYYLGGPDGTQADWTKATVMLSQCLLSIPTDGPSLAIREYIQSHRQPTGDAPSDWAGYRSLDSK